MKIRRIIILVSILCISGLMSKMLLAQVKLTQRQKWEKKIANYARLDSIYPPKDSVILFVGSSTIENWKSLAADFAEFPVLNRGISGTKTVDLLHYVNKVVQPYQPRQIFIYEGDNDIGYKWSPDSILTAFKALFLCIRKIKPDADIYFISIKPAPVRLKHLARIIQTNQLIKDFVQKQPNAGYVDVFTPMMSKNGGIDPANYRPDGLHLTANGYTIWKKVVGAFIR